jgi:hypothetical protein
MEKAFRMSNDDQDFIERAVSAVEELHGLPPDNGKMIRNFALYGLTRRTGMLERMDAELRGDIDSGSHGLRRRVKLMALRRKMGDLHEALRIAGR